MGAECQHPVLTDNPEQPGVHDYICSRCGARVSVKKLVTHAVNLTEAIDFMEGQCVGVDQSADTARWNLIRKARRAEISAPREALPSKEQAAREAYARWHQGKSPDDLAGQLWRSGYMSAVVDGRRPVETEVPHIMAAIARSDASSETTSARDTGILDHFGQRILEGDRVRVDWTAELGITELSCTAIGTVVYMPDKITAAWFVKFDELYKRSVTEEGVYEADSQMLVQAREIGDECLIHFEKIGALKTNGEPV